MRFADLVEKHNDELAALETWDNGKPYEQAATVEVPMFARLMRYYAGRLKLEMHIDIFQFQPFTMSSVLFVSSVRVTDDLCLSAF